MIISAFPDLISSTFKLITVGWHSTAIDVDDHLIFKFPRHKVAQGALVKEAALLAVIRLNISIAVPDMRILKGPPLYSIHEKLKGEHLVTAQYDILPEDARQHLGDTLGRFYAKLHQLHKEQMVVTGAGPIEMWQTPAAIRKKALPALSPEFRALAANAIAKFEHLPPDPYGMTYGFFDGHGWNMAFDHAWNRLNGIYDFADSGFGPLHQEFILSIQTLSHQISPGGSSMYMKS